MQKIIFICLISAISLWLGFIFLKQPHQTVLKVMTYPSFTSPYGPGPVIQKEFEPLCNCKIRWVQAEDSTLMIQKLGLRSDGLGVDVVIGLDQLTLPLAFRERKWKNISLRPQNFIPLAKSWILQNKNSLLIKNNPLIHQKIRENPEKKIPPVQSRFKEQNSPNQDQFTAKQTLLKAVPVSWSPLSFISRESRSLPQNWPSLIQEKKWDKKISLPHPRYSTVGLQFYFWVVSFFKTEEKVIQFLKEFKKKVYFVSHSWSSSYGLFQKKFADLTFTYQTSWAYHFIEENQNYFFAVFNQGHPYQMEYSAILQTCRECALAEQFVQFLLQKDIQKILMTKNYMLPVISGVQQGTPFERLDQWNLISYKKINTFLAQKEKWLKIWDRIFL